MTTDLVSGVQNVQLDLLEIRFALSSVVAEHERKQSSLGQFAGTQPAVYNYKLQDSASFSTMGLFIVSDKASRRGVLEEARAVGSNSLAPVDNTVWC